MKVKSIKDEEFYDERANVYRKKGDVWEVNKIRGEKLINAGYVVEVQNEPEYSYSKPRKGVREWEKPTDQ